MVRRLPGICRNVSSAHEINNHKTPVIREETRILVSEINEMKTIRQWFEEWPEHGAEATQHVSG
jgi:hypothetical protein